MSVRGASFSLRHLESLLRSAFLLLLAINATGANTPQKTFPSPALSAAEERRTFQLAPGLRVDLVAAEPLVEDPVAMTFDEDGRLWVVEMRGFMPNVQGTGEIAPVGRVVVLEDTDSDGRADKRTVFLDRLVLPRAVAVVRGGALVADHEQLWFAEDTNGDHKADRKTVVDANFTEPGSPEHRANGLWHGLDNWIYNAKSRVRYRFRDGQWVRGETEFRGQWGICHDDFGRLIFNYNWSQLHGDLVPPSVLTRNPHHIPTAGISVALTMDQRIFPLRPNPAVNRGYIPGALNEQGRLVEFTAACAPLAYRGDALPAPFRGNAFVCEPAGNLIRRNLLASDGLNVTASAAQSGVEFLASTDERFRPVWLADGPDGALYIADMYRGVIQHRAHMTPYLRAQSIQRRLQKPIHRGRIWRVVPEGWNASPAPRLSRLGAADLVALLADVNGWRRDTAQRLLVERREVAALPTLREMALSHANPLARLHALWTLEGLGDPEPALLLPVLAAGHPRVQAAAIRVIEQLTVRRPDAQSELLSALVKLHPDANEEVRLQIALTAGSLRGATRLPLLADIVTRHTETPLVRDAVMSSLRDEELAMLRRLWSEAAWQAESPGRAMFLEALASATVRGGQGDQIQDVLGLLDAKPEAFGWRQRGLLAGIAIHAGRRDFQTVALAGPPGVVVHAEEFIDRAVRSRLDKLPRMFSWPGHKAQSDSEPQSRRLTDKEEKLFVLGRQQYVVACAGCHGSDGAGLAPLGPPLLDSPWVLGSEQRLVRILLHGLEGPIRIGETLYGPPNILPEMPSLAALDNESLAAVLTYIRREWGHEATPVTSSSVATIRVNSQGRMKPWTESELQEITGP